MSSGLFRLANVLGDGEYHRRVARHSRGCLENLLEHQSSSGAVPILIDHKRGDLFGCLLEDGSEVNQAKPVLGQFALNIAKETGETAWLEPLFDKLLGFYVRWESRYRHSSGLLVWGSDVAIGVDNDPTTYGRPDFSSANILLNCFYHEDLKAAAILARRLGRREDSQRLQLRMTELAGLVRNLCWDRRDRFFYTVDVQCEDRRHEKIPWAEPGMPIGWATMPLRIQMFTGFLPMWCGIATKAQARALVAEHYLNPKSFHARWGVRTLSRDEPMYSLAASGNPSNWLGPIWIIANYLVWRGLVRYGFSREAEDLAKKTVKLLQRDLSREKSIHEYYHPDTGAPLMNPGFFSWNVLVLKMMEPIARHP
jgi:putative isomerase